MFLLIRESMQIQRLWLQQRQIAMYDFFATVKAIPHVPTNKPELLIISKVTINNKLETLRAYH